MSGRGNVRLGKFPVGGVSFGEVSGRGMLRSGKCPLGKCPSGKCQSENCPRRSVSRGTVQSGNCPQTIFIVYFEHILYLVLVFLLLTLSM